MNQVILCGVLVLLTSCSSVVRKQEPTLSHVHIGHAITGWEAAPNNQGLLVAAELYAIEAKVNCDLMLEAAANGEKQSVKDYLSVLSELISPTSAVDARTSNYGMRRLFAESLVHLNVASEIFDASLNVRRTMAELRVKGQQILNRIDELEVFLDSALASDDIDELKIYAEEIASLMGQISGQSDNSSDYGILQFRRDIEAMIAREDPPYQTINKFYLFSIGI